MSSRKPLGRQVGPRRPPRPLRLSGLSRRLLGPSWGALGASGRRLGRPGGCPGPPRRRPESLREAILGATFAMHARGPRKSSNFKEFSYFSERRFAVFFHVVVLPCGAAGTNVNSEKSSNFHKLLQCNLLLRVFRAPCEKREHRTKNVRTRN